MIKNPEIRKNSALTGRRKLTEAEVDSIRHTRMSFYREQNNNTDLNLSVNERSLTVES